jgi:acetyl-CoA carboxylase biotin carboxyl carrier protein
MLHETIKRLIEILKSEDVDEIEVRRFWTTVRVVRHPRSVHIESARIEPQAAAEQAPHTGDSRAAAAAGLEQITSPMVGTYYGAPGPDSEPFVYEGKRIERGEVICIIEAMKLMNEIEAEQGGVIRKIFVKDSEPVEFGQPLFLVESA